MNLFVFLVQGKVFVALTHEKTIKLGIETWFLIIRNKNRRDEPWDSFRVPSSVLIVTIFWLMDTTKEVRYLGCHLILNVILLHVMHQR